MRSASRVDRSAAIRGRLLTGGRSVTLASLGGASVRSEEGEVMLKMNWLVAAALVCAVVLLPGGAIAQCAA